MKRRHMFLLAGAICMPTSAAANAGVPMIAITLPWMAIWLLPVIFSEAWVYKRNLGLTFRRAAISSGIANLVSTFVGVPITWFALFLLQILSGGGGVPYDFNTPLGKFLAVTWQAPWVMPFESDLGWMTTVAMAVLFIPFFLMSWWIEGLILLFRLNPEEHTLVSQRAKSASPSIPDKAWKPVRRAARNANALSYSVMLLVFVLLDIIFAAL